MALEQSLPTYEESLRTLINRSIEHQESSRLPEGVVSFRTGSEEETGPEASPEERDRLVGLARAADDFIRASQGVEADLDDGGETAEQLAALLSGHWLAASTLLAAISGTADGEGSTPELNQLHHRTLAAVAEPPELADELVNSDSATPGPTIDAQQVLLTYARDHEVDRLLFDISGGMAVAGGSEDDVTTAIDHIVAGLSSSVNKIVVAAASSALGTGLVNAGIAFAEGKSLTKVARARWSVAKHAVLRILDEAVRVSRKLIGAANTKALEKWIGDRTTGLLVSAEQHLLGALLQTPNLTAKCDKALVMANPAGQQQVDTQLIAVSANYDKRQAWGNRGAIVLGQLPAALASPPVAGLVAFALLAYQLWSAVDYLDWPELFSKGLLDRATGVRRTVESVTGPLIPITP